MIDDALDYLDREDLIEIIEIYRLRYWQLLEDYYDLYHETYGDLN